MNFECRISKCWNFYFIIYNSTFSVQYLYVGVTFGPGFTLIRLQALTTGPVSAAIPNAIKLSKAFACRGKSRHNCDRVRKFLKQKDPGCSPGS
jgi:hypothetical protein